MKELTLQEARSFYGHYLAGDKISLEDANYIMHFVKCANSDKSFAVEKMIDNKGIGVSVVESIFKYFVPDKDDVLYMSNMLFDKGVNYQYVLKVMETIDPNEKS